MPRRRIESSSVIVTHARLFQVARFLREKADEGAEGRAHYLLASLVFCAFALEAYLNHVGSATVEHWEERERSLSVRNKVREILASLSIAPDLVQRPWVSVDLLISLRHQLAHGRTRHVSATHFDEADRDAPFAVAVPDWEAACEPSTVDRFLDDIRQIRQCLDEAAGLKEPVPGYLGTIGGAISIVDDEGG